MSVRNGTSLHVLVTCGGTSEKIDEVREITNNSTGRLGSLIADAFAHDGADVTYLCGESAQQPSLPMKQIVTIGGVQQLAQAMERLLGEHRYDCVIHSMAVSDYTVRTATIAESLATAVVEALDKETIDSGDERVTQVICQAIQRCTGDKGKKISSNLEDMVLLMEKTPKVIGLIKRLQPETILVGFKLLVGVPEEELKQVAQELMERSGSDFILANDLEGISGDQHKAILIGACGKVCHLETKQQIAQAIVDNIIEEKGRRDL